MFQKEYIAYRKDIVASYAMIDIINHLCTSLHETCKQSKDFDYVTGNHAFSRHYAY